MAKKKRIGIGAKCLVMVRFMHPSPVILESIVNCSHKDRLNYLLVIGQDEIVINKVKKPVITFCHETFEGKVLYCCPRYANVIVEGPESQFFNLSAPSSGNKDDDIAAETEKEDKEAGQTEIP